MLGRKNAQVSLFDIASIAPGFTLPPDSIYERMRQLGSRLVKDEHFAAYYSPIGRPSVPLALLSKVLLLM